MGRIKAIITDFDGTLVNTLMSNYLAYREAFESYNYQLSLDEYKQCYGLRFDEFCNTSLKVCNPCHPFLNDLILAPPTISYPLSK